MIMANNEKKTIGYITARASYLLAMSLYHNFQKVGIDLPHAQFVILRHLYEKNGQTQQELADTLFKDKAAIKRTIDNLISRNYVKKIKDGKTFRIFVTNSAIDIKTTVEKVVENTIASSLKNISNTEYDICYDVLYRIIDNIVKNYEL